MYAQNKQPEMYQKRLIKSLMIVAGLIEQGNQELWPICDKLELELNKLKERSRVLSEYLER